MEEKITYYLGAGASRNAVPIWKEQSEAMMILAKDYLGNDNFKTQKKLSKNDNASKMLWDIGYFGYKGFKFGTVDTYAKKLVLNHSNTELWKLKLAVSNFFTIWQYSNNFPKKDNSIYTDQIDRRYISLLASILEEGGVKPKIKENISFISWNYDLQLETAYKEFCDNKEWKEITQYLKFQSNNHSDLKICHLNGYHGFYKTTKNNNEINCLDRVSDLKDYKEIIKKLEFTYDSQDKGSIDYTSHINYAWEKKENDIAENARKQAKNIINNSDIIVVIGYSFPPFNRSIDKEILGQIKESSTVLYQDPNASTSFLERVIPNWKEKNIKLEVETNNMEYFILPDDF